ncbi:MAG TPA: hypothetical protein VGS22_16135 [Thermoanaerobaculia bacterium]|nr:hypothetical protein [Thermoanaerobaculia bacterium]
MFPGHMGMEPPEGRLLWAGFMALIVGVPSSLILRVWARKSSLRKAAVVGLGLGCFLEYLLESMLGLMLNSHHSESAGPFMSSEAPLISFRVDSVEPIGTVLNMISSLLIRTLYPLDVTGFYVLLLIPLAGGVLALMLTKKVGGDV